MYSNVELLSYCLVASFIFMKYSSLFVIMPFVVTTTLSNINLVILAILGQCSHSISFTFF